MAERPKPPKGPTALIVGDRGPMSFPAKTGHVEIGEGAGRCIVDGCKVRGGGLIRIANGSGEIEDLPKLAWHGKAVIVCGEHLLGALTLVWKLAEDEDA